MSREIIKIDSSEITARIFGVADAYVREIEAACGMKITAIVNNSNLGELTDRETVLSSEDYIKRLSEMSGLPVKFTSVRADIADMLDGEGYFPMTLQEKYY